MAIDDNSAWRTGEHPEGIWKGIVAGAVAGLAASWVMNRFQSALAAVSNSGSDDEAAASRQSEKSQDEQQEDDATQRTADRIARSALGRPLSRAEKDAAGPIVHYAFGSMMGGLYGGLTTTSREVSRGWGMPFGAALWLTADEVAVPALGLGQSPTEAPLSSHVSALLAHLVYGATTGVVYRVVRRAIA